MLGYIPDRAYYLTVNRTVDLGVLVWSPINLCPPENETLPCPAPVGAVVPWHAVAAELALPAPRTDGTARPARHEAPVRRRLGRRRRPSRRSTSPRRSGTGNFDTVGRGPGAARAAHRRQRRARVGQRLRDRRLRRRRRADDDRLRPDARRPDRRARRVAAGARGPDPARRPRRRGGLAAPDGILLIGGDGPGRPRDHDLKSSSTTTGALGEWEPEAPLARAAGRRRRRDRRRLRLGLRRPRRERPGRRRPARRRSGSRPPRASRRTPTRARSSSGPSNDAANLPAARDDAAGLDGQRRALPGRRRRRRRPAARAVLVRSPRATGDIPEWKHLDVSDLPVGLDRAAAPSSPARTRSSSAARRRRASSTTSVRANAAPQSPFFQLGLVGATVPGLKIDGEIGQQLGYLNAAGAGTVNFVILILIGWAFAHKAQAQGARRAVLRRRR